MLETKSGKVSLTDFHLDLSIPAFLTEKMATIQLLARPCIVADATEARLPNLCDKDFLGYALIF